MFTNRYFVISWRLYKSNKVIKSVSPECVDMKASESAFRDLSMALASLEDLINVSVSRSTLQLSTREKLRSGLKFKN